MPLWNRAAVVVAACFPRRLRVREGEGEKERKKKYRPLRTIKGPSSAPPPLHLRHFSRAAAAAAGAGASCWCRLPTFDCTTLQNR